MTRCLDQNAET